MKSVLVLIQLIAQVIGSGPALPEPALINSPGELSSPGEFHSIYKDRTFFLSVIKQTESRIDDMFSSNVTGITVPHHLLAKDMIAEIFYRISQNQYKTIILLSPDHFNRGTTSFSTTTKDFETVFGKMETSKTLVHKIIEQNEHITKSSLFSREHGVHAELPFVKYYFPDSKIVVIAIRIETKKDDLDSLYQTLAQSIDPSNTLIIQSTDFSHYLDEKESNQKDLQTISILESGINNDILKLHQPDNIDSRGAQYLQSKLQSELYKSDLSIIHNKNSQHFTKDPVAETTSYITQLYTRR